MFVSAGLDLATIQREEISEQQVSNLFWVSVALSSLVAALLAASSPAIAWLNHDPRLMGVISASAFTLVIHGLTIQHQAILIRNWMYDRLLVIQVAATVVSQAAAVFVAWRWRSYWALIVLSLTFAACRAILTFWFAPWRPRRFRRGAGSRQMVEFGANLLGFNIMHISARNSDNFLIGTCWGYGQLGSYERAYRIFLSPITQLNAPLRQVAMPALSRLQNEPQRYRLAYLRILKLISMVTMPLAATAVVHSDLVIFTILGSQWDASVPIFAWLGFAAITQSAFDTLGWLFISQGRSNEYFRWGIAHSVLFVASFVLGLPWGAVGVAISYTAVFYLACVPLGIWTAGRRGPVCSRDIWQTLLSPALLAVGAAAGSCGGGLCCRYESLCAVLACLPDGGIDLPRLLCMAKGRAGHHGSNL